MASPDRPVGQEFEPTGWPIPPGYSYETPLGTVPTMTRTYDEYCGTEGNALVRLDLHRMIDASVREVLTLRG